VFIDVHVHLRRARGFPREWDQNSYATPDELIAIFDRLGVDKAVVLPGVSPECCHVPQSLETLLETLSKYDRLIPFCNCDPRFLKNSPDAPLAEFLQFYKDKGCKGVGEVTANLYFDNPMVENLFAACQETKLPLTFHIGPQIGGCYGLVDDPGLPRLEKALEKFPELIFLGHSQPFWAEIAKLEKPEDRTGYPTGPVTEGRVPELMRKYPNLHGDLSANSGYNAVSRDEKFGVRFFEEFQDRLYFGTDICSPAGAACPTQLAGYLTHLHEEGKISRDCFEKIAHCNAEKLLGL